MRIHLVGELGQRAATLDLEFVGIGDYLVTGLVRLCAAQFQLDVSWPCIYSSDDIAACVEQLRRLHQSLSGTAVLPTTNFHSDSVGELVFSVVDATRGRLTVEFRQNAAVSLEGLGEELKLDTQLHFADFQIEQSSLPAIINGLHDLLRSLPSTE